MTVLSALLVAAAFVAVTAASGATTGKSAKKGVLKIGITDALSGPGAFYGTPQLGAWKYVAKEFNKKGGVKIGKKMYKIKLFADDDQWNPTTVRQVVDKQVLQDKVNVVVTSGDPQDPVVIPVTESHKVILEDRSANVTFVSKPHHYVINTWTTANISSRPYYKALLKLHPDIKSVYGIAIDYQYDRNNDAWDKQVATSLGLKWLGQTIYPTNTVDFSSVLAQAVNAHPDLIALGSEGSATPAILKTLRQLGYTGYIGSDVAAEDLQKDIQGAGAAANGFYQLEPISWPATKKLRHYKRAYGRLQGSWNALAADQVISNEMLIHAYHKAGTLKPAKVIKALGKLTARDWLLKGKWKARLGGTKTYGQKRQIAFPLALNQAVNGKPKTVRILKMRIP